MYIIFCVEWLIHHRYDLWPEVVLGDSITYAIRCCCCCCDVTGTDSPTAAFLRTSFHSQLMPFSPFLKFKMMTIRDFSRLMTVLLLHICFLYIRLSSTFHETYLTNLHPEYQIRERERGEYRGQCHLPQRAA